jgi:hypothetical protein
VGLSLPVSSTLASSIYGSLAYTISALSIIVHPEISAAHFPQSTQESWASRTHVESRTPGYPGLDSTVLQRPGNAQMYICTVWASLCANPVCLRIVLCIDNLCLPRTASLTHAQEQRRCGCLSGIPTVHSVS